MKFDKKWISAIAIGLLGSIAFTLYVDYQNDLETQQYREANARYEKALTDVDENYDVKFTKNDEGLWINQYSISVGDTAEFLESWHISEVKPANQIESNTMENLDLVESQIEEEGIEPTYKVHISDGLSITNPKK